MSERRNRPARVERQLRQEAGYGCCVCGNPIFVYHHIIPYASEAHHRPEDMMILCPNHHDAVEPLGPITEGDQRSHKANPHNIREGLANGMLTVDSGDPVVALADGTVLEGNGPLIEVDGEALLGVVLGEQGTVLLTAHVFDADDKHLVTIRDNEWSAFSPMPWDVEFSYRRLTVRSAERRINLSIDTRGDSVLLRAELWRKHRHVSLGKAGVVVDGGIRFSGFQFSGGVIDLESSSGVLQLNKARHRLGRNDPCWCRSGRKVKQCHPMTL
jgi:hypothetical protein